MAESVEKVEEEEEEEAPQIFWWSAYDTVT